MHKKVLCLLLVILITVRGFSQQSNSFSIVELFTAEGCSSCPAADALLGEMTGILKKEGKNIIPLSFHVDYWNKFGWVDPYSQAAFTGRQKKYMAALNLSQLYTPEMIVNGTHEFPGSNPFAFREQCLNACAETPAYLIDASAAFENNKIHIRWSLSKKPHHVSLNIAIAEEHIEHLVEQGENKNKTLRHTNVVKGFITIEPSIKGGINIDMPADLSIDNCLIVLFLQDPQSMNITGAESFPLRNN
jgi:hypothetical protein